MPRTYNRFLSFISPQVVKNLDVVATCSTGGGGQIISGGVYAQAFLEGDGGKKVIVVNKGNTPQDVTYVGATGGAWMYIDESTGFGPAVTTTLAADTWTLAPFGLGILRLA